jgi:hypothetical protein
MLSDLGSKPAARLHFLCGAWSVRGAWVVLCCGAGQRQFFAREMARGKVGSPRGELLQAACSPVRKTEDGDNMAP